MINGHNVISGASLSRDAMALWSRPADQLRGEWQCRLLVGANGGKSELSFPMNDRFAVALVMIGHSYFEAMSVLLRVAFPNFCRLQSPCWSGPATIVKTGQVVCTYIDSSGHEYKNVRAYDSEDALIKDFRDLADDIKFDDADREAMFACLKRWVTRDNRLKAAIEDKA